MAGDIFRPTPVRPLVPPLRSTQGILYDERNQPIFQRQDIPAPQGLIGLQDVDATIPPRTGTTEQGATVQPVDVRAELGDIISNWSARTERAIGAGVDAGESVKTTASEISSIIDRHFPAVRRTAEQAIDYGASAAESALRFGEDVVRPTAAGAASTLGATAGSVVNLLGGDNEEWSRELERTVNDIRGDKDNEALETLGQLVAFEPALWGQLGLQVGSAVKDAVEVSRNPELTPEQKSQQIRSLVGGQIFNGVTLAAGPLVSRGLMSIPALERVAGKMAQRAVQRLINITGFVATDVPAHLAGQYMAGQPLDYSGERLAGVILTAGRHRGSEFDRARIRERGLSDAERTRPLTPSEMAERTSFEAEPATRVGATQGRIDAMERRVSSTVDASAPESRWVNTEVRRRVRRQIARELQSGELNEADVTRRSSELFQSQRPEPRLGERIGRASERGMIDLRDVGAPVPPEGRTPEQIKRDVERITGVRGGPIPRTAESFIRAEERRIAESQIARQEQKLSRKHEVEIERIRATAGESSARRAKAEADMNARWQVATERYLRDSSLAKQREQLTSRYKQSVAKREEVITELRDKRDLMKRNDIVRREVQQSVRQYVQESIPAEKRGKYLTLVERARNYDDLNAAMQKVQQDAVVYERVEALKDLADLTHGAQGMESIAYQDRVRLAELAENLGIPRRPNTKTLEGVDIADIAAAIDHAEAIAAEGQARRLKQAEEYEAQFGVGPSDAPTDIENVVTRTLKAGQPMWRGTARAARAMGMKRLGDRLDAAVDKAEAYHGELATPFIQAMRPYNGAEKQAELDAYTEHYRLRESGDRTGADAAIANHPLAKELVRLTEMVGERTGKVAEDLDIHVVDGSGRVRPGSRGLGKDWFPRVFKREWLDALRDPNRNIEKILELADILHKSGTIEKPTFEAAMEFLRRQNLFSESSDFLSGLERAREAQLPRELYDTSIEAVLDFIPAWSERVANIEAFGQRLKGRGYGVGDKDLLDFYGELPLNDTTKNWLRALRARIDGDPYGNINRRLGQFQRLSSLTMLTGVMGSLKNLYSAVTQTGVGMGFGRSARQLARMMNPLRQAHDIYTDYDWAREMGVLRDDLDSVLSSQILFSSQDGQQAPSQDVLGRITRKALRLSLFTGTEEFGRVHSALTAKSYLRAGLESYQSDPNSRASRQYQAGMKRMGIEDPAALMAEGGSGPLTEQFIRSSVRETQGGYKLNQVPIWANHPTAKVLFQFGKWGMQATQFIYEHGIKPAAVGTEVNGRRVYDFKPLARMMIAYPALGEALQLIAGTFLGRERTDASIQEIMNTATEDEKKALALSLERVVNDVLYAGTLGVWGDYGLSNVKAAFDRTRYKTPFEPPSMSALTSLTNLGLNAWEMQDAPTGEFLTQMMKDAREEAFGQVALARNVRNMAFTVANRYDLDWQLAQNHEAIQTRRQIRSAASRFAEDTGLEISSPFTADRVQRRANYPILSAIKENLNVGNAEGAREVLINRILSLKSEIDSENPDKSEDERIGILEGEIEELTKSLQSSISASRPIKVGTFTNEEVIGDFGEWAARRLPEERLQSMIDLDQRYGDASEELKATMEAAVEEAGRRYAEQTQ